VCELPTVWKDYDESICGAITQELPKTWTELWKSTTLRRKIGSKRTLQLYLDYLRKEKTVVKQYDEERDSVIYRILDPKIRSAGQRLDAVTKKLEEVREEAAKALHKLEQDEMEAAHPPIPDQKSIDMFEKIAAPLLGSRSPRTLIGEIIQGWIYSYMMIMGYYLKGIFHRESIERVKQHVPTMLEFYYFNEPLDMMRRNIQADMDFLATAIAAKHYSLKEVEEAIAHWEIWLMKVGFVRPTEIKGRSYDSISDEMEHKKKAL